jgi:hypothetical protein
MLCPLTVSTWKQIVHLQEYGYVQYDDTIYYKLFLNIFKSDVSKKTSL